MARPRKDDGGPSACERLRSAFWTLLADEAQHDITVRALTSAAHVNHNTFYYHYDNVDALACDAVVEAFPRELMALVVRGLVEGRLDIASLASADAMTQRYAYMRAASRHGSPQLLVFVRDMVLENLLARLGVARDELTPDDIARVDFLWGGILALVGSEHLDSFEKYGHVIGSGVSDAAHALVMRIAAEHGRAVQAGETPPAPAC